MKKFLNKLIYIKNYVINLHHKVKQYNINAEPGDMVQNPYQAFGSWFLEILTYGLLITVVLNMFISWQGWLNLVYILGTGILRWLIIDFINEIRGK